MRSISFKAGFTLIEVLVAMVVLTIVLGIGIPQFNGIMHTNRVSGASTNLHSLLQLTRSEAVKRAKTVTLCPSSGRDATATCADSTDWTLGWLVVDADGEVIRIEGDFNDSISVALSTAAKTFEFNSVGALDGGAKNLFTLTSDGHSRFVCTLVSGKSFSVTKASDC